MKADVKNKVTLMELDIKMKMMKGDIHKKLTDNLQGMLQKSKLLKTTSKNCVKFDMQSSNRKDESEDQDLSPEKRMTDD